MGIHKSLSPITWTLNFTFFKHQTGNLLSKLSQHNRLFSDISALTLRPDLLKTPLSSLTPHILQLLHTDCHCCRQ